VGDNILFDKLIYIDKLKEAGVSDQQARGHADALNDALHTGIATHSDILTLQTDIAALRNQVELRFVQIELQIDRIVIRLGTLVVVVAGLCHRAEALPPCIDIDLTFIAKQNQRLDEMAEMRSEFRIQWTRMEDTMGMLTWN
jgi:hypothetical protein